MELNVKFKMHFHSTPSSSDANAEWFSQELPAERIQSEFNMFEEFVRAPMPFKPIGIQHPIFAKLEKFLLFLFSVDGNLVDDPFLPEEPLELLKKGTWNKVAAWIKCFCHVVVMFIEENKDVFMMLPE